MEPEMMLSSVVNTPSSTSPNRRFGRRALLVGGGVALVAGAAAGIANTPRRADGLPATIDLASARALGDGFFLVDGWVLTAKDLEVLKAAAAAP
jgi:hypothetical protein